MELRLFGRASPISFFPILFAKSHGNLLDHTFSLKSSNKRGTVQDLAPFILIIVRHPKVVFVEYTVLNKSSQKALHFQKMVLRAIVLSKNIEVRFPWTYLILGISFNIIRLYLRDELDPALKKVGTVSHLFPKALHGFLFNRIVFLNQIDFWKLFLALKFNT